MRITSLVEFAARIMVRLAGLAPQATLSADKLSELENISRDYVDQILHRLRKGELVVSRRGAQGGYALARPASQISVGAVIRSVEGGIFEEVCERYSCGEQQCHHLTACGLRPVWERLGELIEGYLDGVTLDQLVAPEVKVKGVLASAAAFRRMA